MTCRLGRRLAPLFVVCWVALQPGSVGAASRYIGTSGTATDLGRRTITIEPVSLAAQAPIIVDVTVPSGSTASNTTLMIRDSLDAALPPEYVVSTVNSTTVQINRTTGGFGMTLTGTVPGQTIVEVPPPPRPPAPFSAACGVPLC